MALTYVSRLATISVRDAVGLCGCGMVCYLLGTRQAGWGTSQACDAGDRGRARAAAKVRGCVAKPSISVPSE